MSIDEPASAEPIPEQFDVGRVIDVIQEDGFTQFRIQAGTKGFHARPASAFLHGLMKLGIDHSNAEILDDADRHIGLYMMSMLFAFLAKGKRFNLIIKCALDGSTVQKIIDIIHGLNEKR